MLDFFMQVQEPSGGGGGAGTGAYNSDENNFPATPTHAIVAGGGSSGYGINIYDISGGSFSLSASYFPATDYYKTSSPSKGMKYIVVKDGYAYSICNDSADLSIKVTDVTDPTTIGASQQIGSVSVSNTLYAIHAHPTKNVLWAYDSGRIIYTIDISNPASPSIIGTLTSGASNTFMNVFFSPDGEYMWYWQWGVSNSECWQYELDASNNPSNETIISISSGSTTGLGATTRDTVTFAVSPRTGDYYWVVTQRDLNRVRVFHLGGDYVFDSDTLTTDSINFDNIYNGQRPINYVTNYDPSADFAFVFNERDDNEISISTYTGTTWTNVANRNVTYGYQYSMDVFENNIFTGDAVYRTLKWLEWTNLTTLTEVQTINTGIPSTISDITLFAP